MPAGLLSGSSVSSAPGSQECMLLPFINPSFFMLRLQPFVLSGLALGVEEQAEVGADVSWHFNFDFMLHLMSTASNKVVYASDCREKS